MYGNKKKISKTNTAIKKKIILVVKKTPKIKNIDKIKKSVVENVIKPVHLEEGTSKNFINNLIRLKESPRTLAIKLQAEKRNIYNNKFVNPDLFRR